MKKLSFPHATISLHGLPWFEHNQGRLQRFPKELKEEVNRDLWDCSQSTAGARLRFRSDTTALGIEASWEPFDPKGFGYNMSRYGQAALDAYVDGKFWAAIIPQEQGELEAAFFQGAPRAFRQFTIYLPNYHCIEVRSLSFDEEAVVLPPDPFAVAKPVVFYGTSITQGGCASRSGLSYQAMLCREWNLDFVNLGFSGLGRGEAVVARAIARIDASCYVLDFGQNNPTLEDMEAVYQPFVDAIRRVRPETPLLLTTPIYYAHEQWNEAGHADQERKRDVVRKAYQWQRDAGDQQIWLLEGKHYLCDPDGQVDGGHPNDLGFAKMAAAMRPVLAEALGLEPG